MHQPIKQPIKRKSMNYNFCGAAIVMYRADGDQTQFQLERG